MDDKQIQEIAEKLDAQVPRENAAVRMEQYGGQGENRIVANRLGYLRLGIEFLKAAIAQPMEAAKEDKKNDEPDEVDIDLDYMATEDSEITFEWFQRTEDISPQVETYTLWDKIIPCLMLIAIGGFIIFAFIGLTTVVRFITH